jgi:hypothetical protein
MQIKIAQLELVLAMVVGYVIPERGGVETNQSRPPMLKSLSALAIFLLLGSAVAALPVFAPKVEANELAALAKADRLALALPLMTCATQVWPEIAASCLRTADGATKVLEARLVTARR